MTEEITYVGELKKAEDLLRGITAIQMANFLKSLGEHVVKLERLVSDGQEVLKKRTEVEETRKKAAAERENGLKKEIQELQEKYNILLKTADQLKRENESFADHPVVIERQIKQAKQAKAEADRRLKILQDRAVSAKTPKKTKVEIKDETAQNAGD